MTLAVIFDVDGVLTDSYAPHFASWRQMFAEIGAAFDEATFRRTFGRTNADIFQELYQGRLTDAEVRAWGERKEVLYREAIRAHFTPMPGAAELVDALRASGFSLGVGSSGPPENVALTLRQLQRDDCFGAVVTGADVQRGKPDPQVFLLAAERLGVPPERCAVIEDAPQGVEAALRAGMTSIALTGTAPRTALARAHLVVDAHAELSPQRIAQLIEDAST